ncbi:MAG: FHA domain-containing protein [Anaerolineae bacterium]|nr:FHA domain-containing protein [Anaerolineae bacterium]
MSDGGGFCELHGPYDPPHTTCPYCKLAEQQRHAYGPPPGSVDDPVMVAAPAEAADSAADDAFNGGLDGGDEMANSNLDDLQEAAQGTPPRPVNAVVTIPPDDSLNVGLDDDFIIETVEPDAGPDAGLTAIAPLSIPDEQIRAGDDSQPLPPLGWLVVKYPLKRRGTILPVRANQSIGREGDIRWDDSHLSRQHVRLTVEPPQDDPDSPPLFHLWPFGPTNPVFINGEEVRGATPLVENDEIRLGNTLFVFKVLTD